MTMTIDFGHQHDHDLDRKYFVKNPFITWAPQIKRVGIYSCGFSRSEFKFQSFYFRRLIRVIVCKLQMLSVISFSETSKSLFCSVLFFFVDMKKHFTDMKYQNRSKSHFPIPHGIRLS